MYSDYQCTENTDIKSWYKKDYPDDELGEAINEKITFYDLFETLDRRKSVYKLLGDDIDSIVRERIFEKLANIMDVKYEYIYDQWMLCDED